MQVYEGKFGKKIMEKRYGGAIKRQITLSWTIEKIQKFKNSSKKMCFMNSLLS